MDEVKFNKEDFKLIDNKAKKIINEFQNEIKSLENLNKENLEAIVNKLIKQNETNFKGVGQPLRIAVVGSRFGPGLYDVILSLNKTEIIKRLKQI